MNSAIRHMLARYECQTGEDYINALKEIIQELALLGLWRANFFEHAAFYGGTALRILYQLDRFSEDLDFSLLKTKKSFQLSPYLKAIKTELESLGFDVLVETKPKKTQTPIESAFIKAGTREHLLKIEVPPALADRIPKNNFLKIKLEIDTDPPGHFNTEFKTLLLPIPFSVNVFQLPDLFAGKVHALLMRQWKTRVKGRDFYDFVWYMAREVPLNLKHLEARLRQPGGWSGRKKLSLEALRELLKTKFLKVNFVAARKDVTPFIKEKAAMELWSKEFFIALLEKLKAV